MLDIFAADLTVEVEALLLRASDDAKSLGAVNWGDLRIADIESRQSLLDPRCGPRCVVIIEEASPGCGLADWLYHRLDRDRFPDVWFECEW